MIDSKKIEQKSEQKSEQKATIFCSENYYNHDEFCVKTILYAETPDGDELKKTIVVDLSKDEFKKRATTKWSNTTLCNFLKTTPEDLVNKLPYQPNFDVRMKHTKVIVDAKDERMVSLFNVRIWSKVRKCFVDFNVDFVSPLPLSEQAAMLSVDNLAGYENV